MTEDGGHVMTKYVKCQCGVELTANSEEEIVSLIQAHGREAHNMEVSRDQALALVEDVAD
jgi:predicted small metal-binding protein